MMTGSSGMGGEEGGSRKRGDVYIYIGSVLALLDGNL